jgi:heterodisulfide reductase subunit A
MINLIIDGKQVTAEKGQTVLDAARASGVDIPTLCHHESLPPYGACRFCVMEATSRGKTKLVTACTLPVKEGLEIQTHSEKVRRIRRMLAELMLARCPDSTSVKTIAAEVGVTQSRFSRFDSSPSNNGRPAQASTFVDQNGCILCGMCVRLCDDVLKIGALGFQGRGGKRQVTTPFGEATEACMTCGACSSICPTNAIAHNRIFPRAPRMIPSQFEQGLAPRKPIDIPFPQAVPRVPAIDAENCMHFKTGGCNVCEDNCEAEAINHEQSDEMVELNVGTMIVATGFELFDAKKIARFGHGRLPNVINSLEFERISHASGPTGGEIYTPEGKPPEAVAIIHCVGSRDLNYHEYCSRVCCMYSLKFAHLVKEKTGAVVYNLYIDMRTPGKGYEEFYRRLLREGVHFIRGRCAEVTDVAETQEEKGKTVVVCEDTLLGVTRRLPVDLVILSSALKPAAGAEALARKFSLSCAQGDFFLEKHPKLAPVEASSDGLFLAGACQGPKDIPDSVAQGAAAAACALSLMDKGAVVLEPITAEIESERCSGCKMCISACPYNAIEFDEQKNASVVREELCKGCGTCVATCPSGIATQKGFEDTQIFAEIEGILQS